MPSAFPTSSGASTCTLTQSAPASQNDSTYFVGCEIIRWQSSVARVVPRTLFTSGGPNVMFGTKCPSITSRWRRSAPASTTLRISSPRRAKSAERIDGATFTARTAVVIGRAFYPPGPGVARRPVRAAFGLAHRLGNGGGHPLQQIHAPAAVAPLVVVPAADLHEVADHHRRGGVEDA